MWEVIKMADKKVIDNKTMQAMCWLICKQSGQINNFLLSELIDAIYSNDDIKLSGEDVDFESVKGNKVTVFCPHFYVFANKDTTSHLPLYGDGVDYLKIVKYFYLPYKNNKMVFSTIPENSTLKITVPGWHELSIKINAFCSFLNKINEQIYDSSNFYYKLKIFQLFNKHKDDEKYENYADYEEFEEMVQNEISQYQYKFVINEVYIDEKDKLCTYNAKIMFNIFAHAYNKLSNNDKNIIYSSIKKNTEKIKVELFKIAEQ